METYLDKLILSHPLREPVIRQAIRAFELPAGSRGLAEKIWPAADFQECGLFERTGWEELR